MIPVIETTQPPCKRSSKNNIETDGSEVYKRYCFTIFKLAHLLPKSMVQVLSIFLEINVTVWNPQKKKKIFLLHKSRSLTLLTILIMNV